MRRTAVTITVNSEYYQQLEKEKRKAQKRLGFSKPLTTVAFTGMMARNKIKFPQIKPINLNLKRIPMKNVKK